MTVIAFMILGECASKANSRAIVTRRSRTATGEVRSRPASIKSDKARAYERSALRQIPVQCRVRLAGPLCITLKLFYASERPDLTEDLLLDVLQDRWAYVWRAASSACRKPKGAHMARARRISALNRSCRWSGGMGYLIRPPSTRSGSTTCPSMCG